MNVRAFPFLMSLFVSTSLSAQDLPSENEPETSAPQIIAPVMLSEVEALFPEDAFDADIQADVIVEMDVDTIGVTSNILPIRVIYYSYDEEGYLVETRGLPEEDPWGFVDAALLAVQEYAFEPALLISDENPEGLPTPVRMQWSVGFVIEEEEYERIADETDYQVEENDESLENSDEIVTQELPVNFDGVLIERGSRSTLASFFVELTPTSCLQEEEENQEISCDPVVTVSDENGYFFFAGVPAGEWTIQINETGYESFSTEESIAFGTRLEVRYLIEGTSRDAFRSSTVATAPPREATRHEISMTEIARIPGTNNDALRVVQNLPGVSRSSFGGGDVIIRGSAPEDTLFFVNDMYIPLMYHFGGLRAVIPTELLSGVTFYPGAYGAEYGRAMGGIVEAEINTPRAEVVSGFIDSNLIDSSIFIEAPITENISFQAHARRSYIDAILRPIAKSTDLQLTTAPRYWDWQFKLQGDLPRGSRWNLFYYASDDLFDLVLDDEDMDPAFRGGLRLQTRFQAVQGELITPINENTENSFRLQYSVPHFNFSMGSEIYFDIDVIQYSIRDTITHQLSPNIELRTGVDVLYEDVSVAIRSPMPPQEGQEDDNAFDSDEFLEIDVEGNGILPAAFLSLDLKPVEELMIIPGVRVDHFQRVDQTSFDLRLAIRYQITEPLLLKLGSGSFHQMPTYDQTDDSFGNPELGLQEAIHYTGGLEYAFTEFLSGQFELFYKDLNDRISGTTETRINEDGNRVPAIYSNDGEGRVYGAEFLFRHSLANNFFGWIAYTLSRSERLDAGETQWRLFDYDQTHIFTAIASYDLPKRWTIGARWRYVSGNPFTPISGSVFDTDYEVYLPIYAEANSGRQDPFHQLDLRIDKKWVYDYWRLNAYLDVQNVYNRANQESVNYSYDYSETAPIRGLPIFPSLGLRGSF